eukprot:TRINITY_DN45154_c0_g1_i1.p1 TRINITY_DN45154_c0_g1~~TRINITY_DN45154_c0_g1_i1.p1  ORF type:complete len:399 (-),score=104.99 TRINITY_DN45154_c0_g1_i1:48-1196(-)
MGDDWLFDTITQFLRSPVWTHPIQTFIDENCIVFDSAEENALGFTQVHQAFRDLVDKILGDQLGEFGISPEQFVAACENSQNKELHALVTEYILALDDFQTFKRMMEKRNVELELEALRGLKWNDSDEAPKSEEDPELAAAIAASMLDTDYASKQLEMEQAELAHALAISLALEEERVRKLAEEATKAAKDDSERAEGQRRIEEEHKKTIETLHQTFHEEKEKVQEKLAEVVPAAEPAPVPAPTERPSTAQKPTLGSVRLTRLTAASFGAAKPALPDIVKADKPAAPAPATTAPSGPAQPSAEDIAKRQAYLKAQKEKLIQQQKAEREKELKEFVEKNAKTPEKKPETELDEAHRQMRIALGKRFKEDLIQETRQAALRSGQ